MSKKVIQLCPYYWPHVGGVETHVRQLNQELISQGYEVQVITEQFDRSLPRNEVVGGVTVLRFPTLSIQKRNSSLFNKNRYKIGVFSHLFAYLPKLIEADWIQIHDVFWWIIPFYPALSAKIFTTFHGWEGIFPIPWKNTFQRRLYSSLSKGVIHVGSWIQHFYGDEPNTIVYGGIPRSLSPIKVPHNEYGLRQIPYDFVFLGRLEPENDIKKYIQLVKELTTQKRKIKVLWVGDGKLRKECEKVGDVVGFTPEPGDFIHRGKIVFASSYLSILEAQAYGKIVCSFYSHPLKEAYLRSYSGARFLLIADTVSKMKKLLSVALVAEPSFFQDKAKK